jgi:hypothetical protein
MGKKPLLFYSNLCEFSKTVTSVLIKKGIREEVLLVNVDKYAHMIPPMVTKVPTIMTQDNTIYEDDRLLQFIDNLAAQLRPHEVNPFYAQEMTGGLSDGYSYLDDYSDITNSVERNFSLVSNYQTIQTPKEEDFAVGSGDIDRLRSERDQDIKKIIQSTNGDFQAQRNFVM